MRTTALAYQPTLESTLTVMSGAGRGTVYRVVSSKVTLGRGAENDIVINDDPKCSRNHAEIVFGVQGFEIRDLTDRNVILVDGQECKTAPLRDRSTFTLGNTQFKLSIKQSNNLPALHQAGAPMIHGGHSPSGMPRQNSRSAKGSSPMKLIVGVVAIAVMYLVFSGDPNKNDSSKTDLLADQEFKAAESVKKIADERHRPKSVSPNDVGYNQAQQAFVEGFRDYRKGQFERALSSFQACLSLYPSHTLCTRYMRLTQRRFDELIQYHVVLGSKYRDQNQFGACASSFRNVMVMVKDQGNKRYQEAKANYEACQAHIEERF